MRVPTIVVALGIGACQADRTLDLLPLPEIRDGALILLHVPEAAQPDVQAVVLPAPGGAGRLLEYPDAPAVFYAFEERCGLPELGLVSGPQALRPEPVPSLPSPRRVHRADVADDSATGWQLLNEIPSEASALRLRLPVEPERSCDLLLPTFDIERYPVEIPGPAGLVQATQVAALAGDWFIPLQIDAPSGPPLDSGVYRIRGTDAERVMKTGKIRSMYGHGDDLYVLTTSALLRRSASGETATIAAGLGMLNAGMLSGSPSSAPFELAVAWSTPDRYYLMLVDTEGPHPILDRPTSIASRAAVLWIAPGEAFAFDGDVVGAVDHLRAGMVHSELFPGPTNVRATRLLPDGRALVGTNSGEVLLWSGGNWSQIARFGEGAIRDFEALADGFSVLACGPQGCFGELHRYHADVGFCGSIAPGLRRIDGALGLENGGLVAFTPGLDFNRLDLAVFTLKDETSACARSP